MPMPILPRFRFSGVLLLVVVACAGLACPPPSTIPSGGEVVVVYTSVDEPWALEMKAAFEAVPGNPKVELQCDSELQKTVGLANRLLAERNSPRADVWWASEPGQTIRLQKEGALAAYVSPEAAAHPDDMHDPTGMWTMLALRLRVLVRRTDGPDWPERVPRDLLNLPAALDTLTAADGVAKLAMADPTAGTTATHSAALFQCYGDAAATAWLDALRQRGVIPRGGNAQVVNAVASGSAVWGITDTDDVFSAQAEHKPVAMMVLPGTLAIPNTIAVVADCAHRKAAERFVDFVLSAAGEQLMARVAARHLPTRADVDPPAGFPRMADLNLLPVNWPAIDPHRQRAEAAVRKLWPPE
ncbi:MAG: extracellular solute-binding protein [Planctomycetota bacterium]